MHAVVHHHEPAASGGEPNIRVPGEPQHGHMMVPVGNIGMVSIIATLHLGSGQVLQMLENGPFLGVILHVLEIKKIYQRIVNNVLSVLKLEKRYLHQNGVEFNQKIIGNQFRGTTQQK